MNAMALLCTLHADGPRTLSKLRESGLTDLATLEDQGAERIAEVLAIAPAQARRFVREAGVLRERLRDDVPPTEAPRALDVEEPSVFGGAGGSSMPTAAPASRTPNSNPASDASRPGRAAPTLRGADLPAEATSSSPDTASSSRTESASPTGPPAGAAPQVQPSAGGGQGAATPQSSPIPQTAKSDLSRLSPRDRELVGKVLDRWRDEADGSPPAYEETAGRPLSHSTIDGLTPELAAALSGAGVVSVEQLVEADLSLLSQQLGQPFSTLRRIQFLAKRALAQPLAGSGWNLELQPKSRKYAGAEKPLQGPYDDPSEDPAGPFAH